MSPTFYIVLHEFKVGKAQRWWETAYAAMAPGGGWDDAERQIKKKGFFNHSANAVAKNWFSLLFLGSITRNFC